MSVVVTPSVGPRTVCAAWHGTSLSAPTNLSPDSANVLDFRSLSHRSNFTHSNYWYGLAVQHNRALDGDGHEDGYAHLSQWGLFQTCC